MLSKCLVDEGVQLACCSVRLQLHIPDGGVERLEPAPKLGQLLSGETANLTFKGFDLGHTCWGIYKMLGSFA